MHIMYCDSRGANLQRIDAFFTFKVTLDTAVQINPQNYKIEQTIKYFYECRS